VLKDELKAILKDKGMSKKQQKAARQAYEEIRDSNKELAKELRKAKKSKDFDKMAEILPNIDKNLERELRLEASNKIEVRFRNTSIDVDRSYVSKLKDPDKYVNKLYFNKTFKQVERLIDSGRFGEAKGLLKIAERSKETLPTDKRKSRQIDEQIERLSEELEGLEYDIEDIEAEEDETYDPIFTSGGSSITVTVI